MKSPSIAIVAAVNDENVLAQNLLRSPIVAKDHVELVLLRNQKSASQAYERGMRETNAQLVVFAHQDVYLPKTWHDNLTSAIAELNRVDPNWAVLGCYGVAETGQHVGLVWSSGLQRLLGTRLPHPTQVESVDELVFVVRRGAASVFDLKLPSFHLYGTDVVQNAKASGMRSYVAYLPVVHNSRAVRNLGGGYTAAYNYMRRKWKQQLPIYSTVVPLTQFGVQLLKIKVKMLIKQNFRIKRPPHSVHDPVEISAMLGFENCAE